MPKKSGERVRCAVCGHIGAGKVPKGGDGSELHPFPHLNKNLGIFATKTCEGSYQAAEVLDAGRAALSAKEAP